jgi:hypothetical protein
MELEFRMILKTKEQLFEKCKNTHLILYRYLEHKGIFLSVMK